MFADAVGACTRAVQLNDKLYGALVHRAEAYLELHVCFGKFYCFVSARRIGLLTNLGVRTGSAGCDARANLVAHTFGGD